MCTELIVDIQLTFRLPEDPDLVEGDRVEYGHDDDDAERSVGDVVEKGREKCESKQDDGSCHETTKYVKLRNNATDMFKASL